VEIRAYNNIGNIETSSVGYNVGYSIGFFGSLGAGAVLAGRAAKGTPFPHPPNRGFVGKPTRTEIDPGTLIDRYGSELGRFASPRGTPFEARSLPPEAASAPLRTYEVLRPLPANSGSTAPWYGQPGRGTQFEFFQSIDELVRHGYLRRIE
jgi:hypothetical protein